MEPRIKVIVAIAVLLFTFLLLVPLMSILLLQSYSLAVFFIVSYFCTALRWTCSLSFLRKLLGPHLSNGDVSRHRYLRSLKFRPWCKEGDPPEANGSEEQSNGSMPQETQALTRKEARCVHLLVSRMTSRSVLTFWRVLLLIALLVGIAFVFQGAEESSDTFSDFYPREYQIPILPAHERGFKYHVCNVKTKSFRQSDEHRAMIDVWDLAIQDYAFISHLAYVGKDDVQASLDHWFGYRFAYVEDLPPEDASEFSFGSLYKIRLRLRQTKDLPRIPTNSSNTRRSMTAGHYEKETCILTIRGSYDFLDLLQDARLWFTTVTVQVLRRVFPLGTLWNDVFSTLIYYVSFFDSYFLGRVSPYYTYVAQVARQIDDCNVILTGHSLGGGVAMIVGAMVQRPAISFSGPNAILSRQKFGIERESLDKFAFNVIPLTDVVPQVDDPALHVAYIECTSSFFLKCHPILRTLCELQNTCGSGHRPVLKKCDAEYGYPKPQAESSTST